MGFIKIGIRKNLIYPLMLIIFNFFRKIDTIIISKILEFESSLIMALLMFIGEFIAGLTIFLYELSFLPKRKNSKYMKIKLIQGPKGLKIKDNKFKIYLLIFISSFFDFIEFILSTYYLGQYSDISNTLEIRLSGILTISSALFFIFLLHLPISKHHIFSLSIIFFCLISIIISEYYFQYKYVSNFAVKLLLIFLIHFFNSLLDSIEKYLLEYNFLNPFKTLMLEGLFGIILTTIYSFSEYNFRELNEYYQENSKINFYILILCLFLYFLLCAGRNAYRVATNKNYSPMAKSLTDYFLNPLIILYYFIFEDDFICNEKKNIFFFAINLVFSIIIVFCGCIYNEFLVLYCFNLEFESHKEISRRASVVGGGVEFNEYNSGKDNSFEEEEEDNNSL